MTRSRDALPLPRPTRNSAATHLRMPPVAEGSGDAPAASGAGDAPAAVALAPPAAAVALGVPAMVSFACSSLRGTS